MASHSPLLDNARQYMSAWTHFRQQHWFQRLSHELYVNIDAIFHFLYHFYITSTNLEYIFVSNIVLVFGMLSVVMINDNILFKKVIISNIYGLENKIISYIQG